MFEVIAAILGALVAGMIQYYVNKKKETVSLVDEIDSSSFEVYSDSVAPDRLWQGFRKDWKSYNDSWHMEYNSPEDYVKSHIRRYEDEECGTFKFLFFIKDNIGQFERFVKFQSMVHLGFTSDDIHSKGFDQSLVTRLQKGELPDTLNNIVVYLNKKIKPNQTFFRGYELILKSSKLRKVSIWYLSLDPSLDTPHLILKTTDKRFWKELDEKWNKMRIGAENIVGEKIFERYLAMTADSIKENYEIKGSTEG